MERTKIEWVQNTDGTPGHTWNPWWGCQRVSPGCEHCYAETLAHRYNYRVWGPAKTTGRRMMSENYWRQPLRWDKAAAAAGERHRVFCASMADVFEDHPDLTDPRRRLWELISVTPALDWLLLTKRPENVNDMLPALWTQSAHGVPPNIWIGTSVEDQHRADERIPHLLRVPARVRFLSCEPLLGPVDLSGSTVDGVWIDQEYADLNNELGRVVEAEGWPIHWVIVGGESGAGARPMHPEWARSLRDQCQAAGVAYFLKQMGGARDKGGDLAAIPADLRLREFPR